MIGVIPNPKKTITIDFPIEQVKVAARNIDKLMKSCDFIEENDLFNSYKFTRNEFLSLGAFININLNAVSNNKTQVDVEISRKLGAFDEWVEVQKANKHIEETINSMANIIKNGIPKIEPILKPEIDKTPMSKSKAILTLITFFGVFFGIIYLIIKMVQFGK
jgi:hypothetical protein